MAYTVFDQYGGVDLGEDSAWDWASKGVEAASAVMSPTNWVAGKLVSAALSPSTPESPTPSPSPAATTVTGPQGAEYLNTLALAAKGAWISSDGKNAAHPPPAVRAAVSDPTVLDFRDVLGKGGWTYRQYSNGTIRIVKAPTGHESAIARTYQQADTGGDYSIWKAITDEIGPYPEAGSPPVAWEKIATAAERGDLKTARTTLTAAAMAAGGAAAVGAPVAGSSAVVGLLAAAGVSTSVPVAGWIVAGGLAAAAGAVAVTQAVRRKRSDPEVASTAARLNVADAADMPRFTRKVVAMSSGQRNKLGEKLARHAKGSRGRRKERLQSRLRIVAAVELLALADARRASAGLGQYGIGPSRAGFGPAGGSGRPFCSCRG